MPIWYHLLLAVFFLLLPGAFDSLFTSGARRWHFLILLPMMALFGLHEQVQLLPTLYVNYGGFLFPTAYFFYVLCTFPRAIRQRCALCAFLGAVGSFLCVYACSGWADLYLGGSEPLRMAVMMAYAVAFSESPLEGLCAYTLGFSLSGLIQYADQLIFDETAYLSLGVEGNFIALITGALVTTVFLGLRRRRRWRSQMMTSEQDH